jgi:tRNA threonylcarbamoyladenosine biosynthesis protein TsaB
MLLHLETATAVCSAALSDNGRLVAYRQSDEPRAHAAMLTIFIDELLKQAGIEASAVDAVSISAGPGSYTGLRIASSVAKGFCYAAQKPLIALDTLHIMASGFAMEQHLATPALLCPMIDARRDEVFTAVFDAVLNTIAPSAPKILDSTAFESELAQQAMYFIGDGTTKFKAMINNSNARFFPEFYPKANHQMELAQAKYNAGSFEDIAYFEPNYLKEFYTGK